MQVAVSIPQGKYRVAIAFALLQHTTALHSRVISVHILQDIRMYQRVVQCGIKDSLLIFCTSFNFYTLEIGVPFLPCFLRNGIEILALLLYVQVLTCIGNAHKRHAYLHLNDFILGCIEVHIHTDIIAGNLFLISRIELILPSIGEPFSLFVRPFALFLPVTCTLRHLIYTHNEVNREYSLGIITKSSLQLKAFIFRRTHLFYHCPAFFCESFS